MTLSATGKTMRKILSATRRFVARLGWESALVAVLSLIALVIAAVDLIGGQNISQPVLVGILSLFLLELVSLRARLASQQTGMQGQLSALDSKIADFMASMPLGIRLEDQKTYQNIQNLSNYHDVALRGSSLHGFISANRGFIRNRAAEGCRFRFLVMDPDYYKRVSDSSSEQPYRQRRDIEHVVQILEEAVKDARQQNADADIQLGYLSYPPQFGLLMLDADTMSGRIQVGLYLYYRTDQEQRPHFEITRAMSDHWYRVFQEQFEMTWKHSRKHDFGQVGSTK